MLTFGVEEEFIFLDRETLVPVPVSADIQRELEEFNIGPGLVHGEFLLSQVEYSSPIFSNFQQAAQALWGFRTALADCAEERGVLVAGVGTPFMKSAHETVTGTNRYAGIADSIGLLAFEHYINGLHIHVGIPSQDEGVVALNYLRRWLPILLAMSANSPFWCGRDTAFCSWRAIQYRRWTTAGCPPEFVDAADYRNRTQALIGIGATMDKGSISWSARLSARHPTLEIRVTDAQLEPSTTLLLALLGRALVMTSMTQPAAASAGPELLDAALWHAARHGLARDLVDPCENRLAPAPEVVQSLLDETHRALEASGDLATVTALTEQLLLVGTGADRQRRAFTHGGQQGLAAYLFRAIKNSSSAHEPVAGHLGPNDPRPLKSGPLR
ncbi:hypothetical protein MB46_00570 [Arthrobacter alpinus]|uniref:carboxylate-amine ligase n=1 Tax=Arthrobacter alpinus TaxID=656366 RepID=UPI000678D6DF|nr:YbdK family carboxylate-amine ligase [Arthrobacter alpinus]ALV44230.1 hypothetical protein MB46_00570 [Arthrobacter alpinus]